MDALKDCALALLDTLVQLALAMNFARRNKINSIVDNAGESSSTPAPGEWTAGWLAVSCRRPVTAAHHGLTNCSMVGCQSGLHGDSS